MSIIDLQQMPSVVADALRRAMEGEEVFLSDDGKLLGKITEVTRVQGDNPNVKRRAGTLQGFLKYMADDFNAPLEDFKDYMPE